MNTTTPEDLKCLERLKSYTQHLKPLDANVEAVREKLRQRAEIGLRKYGVTTQRTDWTRLDRLRHALEEACDLCVYLQSEISIAEKEEQ